jgi:hypothetical protein
MKNILFYGNCQLGILCERYLLKNEEFKSKYNVLKPESFGINLDYDWERFQFFPETVFKSNLVNFKKALDSSDIIIFHEIKSDNFPRELCTENIVNEHNKKSLCLTNFWFDPYNQANEIIEHLYDNKIAETPSSILDFLYNGFDLFVEDLVKEEYKKSIEELKNRESRQNFVYSKILSSVKFIENNWKKLLLTENNFPHPSFEYFNNLSLLVLNELGINSFKQLQDPRPLGHKRWNPFNLYDLNYFKKLFPDIKKHNRIDAYKEDVILDYISKQIKKEWKPKAFN